MTTGGIFLLYITLGIVGLLSGITASLGIGGGFVLLIYLTAIASVPQMEAQLLNLLFFIPIGIMSIILHIRHRLIEKSIVLKSVFGGILGVFLGVYIGTLIPNEILSKIWAVFILIIGIRELIRKKPKQIK